jgi:hypothetical protein
MDKTCFQKYAYNTVIVLKSSNVVYFYQVDGTLQSVLNENSIDYAVKFQDLAAHISGNTDCSLLLRKTDSSG